MKKVEDGKVRLIFKLNSRLIDFHIKKMRRTQHTKVFKTLDIKLRYLYLNVLVATGSQCKFWYEIENVTLI